VTGLERPHKVLEKPRETLAPQSGRTLRAVSVPDGESRPLSRGGQRLNAAAAVDSDYLDIPAWLRNQAD